MPDDEIEVPADQPDPPYLDDDPPEPETVRPDTGPLPVPEDPEGEVAGGVEP